MTARPRILVAGVYMGAHANVVGGVVRELSRSVRFDVRQRWVALGPVDPDPEVASVTVWSKDRRLPKWINLNQILRREPLSDDAYVILADDDVELPPGFLDSFMERVIRYDFALAQPARTPDSIIGHRFTTALTGLDARRTRFVEIGPIVAIRTDALDLLLPFPERAGMGWGLDLVWPRILESRGLRMGIVDATPVRHAIRDTLALYTREEAEEQQRWLFRTHDHMSEREAFQVLESYPAGAELGAHAPPSADAPPAGRSTAAREGPEISAIICTRNRAALLDRALAGLEDQKLGATLYEVVVVDDGSTDDSELVCCAHARRLDVRYFRQAHSGLAAARNIGTFAARGWIVLYLDDDDVATPGLLHEHLARHLAHPEKEYCVLHRTEWAPEMAVTPLMDYVTRVGCFLFSYGNLADGDRLDYTYFWGGRVSCKKMLLMQHGLFDPVFRFGCEDIELGFRLRGIVVEYAEQALTQMIRPLDFEGFCERLRRQGRSQWVVSQLHGYTGDEKLLRFTETEDALARWSRVEPLYETGLAIARRLDRLLGSMQERGIQIEEASREPLHLAYEWAFRACKLDGIVEAARRSESTAHQGGLVRGPVKES